MKYLFIAVSMLCYINGGAQDAYHPSNYYTVLSTIPNGTDLCAHGSWHFIWGDEFDGAEIDHSKWMTHCTCSFHGGSDNCKDARVQTNQIVRDENVLVSDGTCKIKLKRESSTASWHEGGTVFTETKDFSTGYLTTYGIADAVPGTPYNSGLFNEGKFEAKVKLCGTHNSHNTMWLWADDGGSEIDIMEFYGNNNTRQTYSLHNYHNPGNPYHTWWQPGSNWSDGSWHTYGCEWDKNFVSFFIDYVKIRTISRLDWSAPGTSSGFVNQIGCLGNGDVYRPLPMFLSPNNTECRLIFSLGLDDNEMWVDECEMEIDWVHIYKRDECTDDLVIPVYNLFPFDNLSAKTITLGTGDVTLPWNYATHSYENKFYTAQSITFLPNYFYSAQYTNTDYLSWGTYDHYSNLLVVPKYCSADRSDGDLRPSDDNPIYSGIDDDPNVPYYGDDNSKPLGKAANNPTNGKKSGSIVLFPNPTQSTITISYPCKQSGQLEISIKDVSGRVVHTESVSCLEGGDTQQVVDIKDYAPGVYFVDLTLNGEHTVKKIVKL